MSSRTMSAAVWTLAAIIVLGAIDPTATPAQVQAGSPFGPGVGGQVHAFAFDPDDTTKAYAGGDVCGVYRYNHDLYGGQWEPWSSGLGFDDLNQSYYVDDLLVVGEEANPAAVQTVPVNRRGVYAATQGGLYFRPKLGAEWVRIPTDPPNYSGGYVNRVFPGTTGSCATQNIPFCSIARDSLTAKLYVGAGTARIDGIPDFYPHPAGHSLWVVDLAEAAPVLRPVCGVRAPGHGGALRCARQRDAHGRIRCLRQHD